MISVFLFRSRLVFVFFFFNDTATTEIYTLSLHDALPIYPHPGARAPRPRHQARARGDYARDPERGRGVARRSRSEEHTSELQSPCNLVCRLLLEKKNTNLLNLIIACRVCYILDHLSRH